MSVSSYDKAVETFETIVSTPRKSVFVKPAHFIAETGQSTSSGYRTTAALEAEGFLRRDSNGAYLLGTAGLRTACSACGHGRLAPVLPPLLLRLRDETQHTAFCAFLSGLDVQIGPFLTGRASRPNQAGRAVQAGTGRWTLPPGTAIEAAFTSQGSDIVHRVQTVLVRGGCV